MEDRRLLAALVVDSTADDTSNGQSVMTLREAIEVVDGTVTVSSLEPRLRQAQITGTLPTLTIPSHFGDGSALRWREF